MLASVIFSAFLLSPTCAFSIPPPPPPQSLVSPSHEQLQQIPLQEPLDAWIQREERIALDSLRANIAPGGRKVRGKGVVDGTVIASPSRSNPDYWYQWVRDAAITMDTLVDVFEENPTSSLGSDMSSLLNAYASLQSTIQRTPNPSGTFRRLLGLGEPKFTVDGAAFTRPWGRPQRDGPALRALTLMHYLRTYNHSQPGLWGTDQGNRFFGPLYTAAMPANSLIKADLEYVSHFWNFSSFDLWEEIEGLHFFNLIVSARSLREGSELARAFGDGGAAEWYSEQAGYIEHLLPKFWNAKKGHLTETLWNKRSGLDCGLLLGSLHALPKNALHEPAMFPPWSDEILISLLALTRDQAQRHPINNQVPERQDDQVKDWSFRATGIGRYPEDLYDGYATSKQGGNPWFLCTSSAAEILYRTASHIQSSRNLSISQLNQPFFQALLAPHPPLSSPTSYDSDDELFHSVVHRLRAAGDQFLNVVRSHVDAQGSMSEQFDRVTGYMRGAQHLTWSYSAFLKAARARKTLMTP